MIYQHFSVWSFCIWLHFKTHPTRRHLTCSKRTPNVEWFGSGFAIVVFAVVRCSRMTGANRSAVCQSRKAAWRRPGNPPVQPLHPYHCIIRPWTDAIGASHSTCMDYPWNPRRHSAGLLFSTTASCWHLLVSCSVLLPNYVMIGKFHDHS